MPTPAGKQTEMLIGVDVGGTFTDLVAWDGQSLRIVKMPSTPPNFERAVIEATERALSLAPEMPAKNNVTTRMVHGSTVATNALLQRAGEPVALVTTEGFADILLIGRQNRPKLYDLRVQRPPPISRPEHCFTVRERVDSRGQIVQPLAADEIEHLTAQIIDLKLQHVAVCLLFSFANPAHEQMIAQQCRARGLTVSLSSELLPEFREYERASTTAINAALRPVVAGYLKSLQAGLPATMTDVRIMQSSGGTVSLDEASEQACRLILSGPAGGVFGAALVAKLAGFDDVISYDMGGTSTDVALIRGGRPQWRTSSTIGGLPIALPMLDIHTVGAGGGSIASIDAGGALRVGPLSAGAIPGPACYGRGGDRPTVTDANLVLGRILPGHFLGGRMPLDVESARRAISSLAQKIDKGLVDAALGIVKVAEANMARAIRTVSSQRGYDPRRFALVSFGGAGGLHVCALAESLEIKRIIVPPYCGVLSALGMIVAPPIADASRTVVQLGEALDDDRLAGEYGRLSALTLARISLENTESVEVYADVRFLGQSHELSVRIDRPSRSEIERAFLGQYEQIYGRLPAHRAIEIVTLRVRRFGRSAHFELPAAPARPSGVAESIELVTHDGRTISAHACARSSLRPAGAMLIVDDEATTYVPPNWSASLATGGMVLLERQP